MLVTIIIAIVTVTECQPMYLNAYWAARVKATGGHADLGTKPKSAR